MPSIFTPKRRQIKRSAIRAISAMVETWRHRNGAWSCNEMMGLSLRAGALHLRLCQLAVENDALPTGIVKVPRTPRGSYAFTVDLDEMR